jgi:hypothetical protein
MFECKSFAGLPDFSRQNIPKRGENVPNDHKMYQEALKFILLPQSKQIAHKKYRHLPLQDLLKFTQIGIFGFKIWQHWSCAAEAFSLTRLRLLKILFFCD